MSRLRLTLSFVGLLAGYFALNACMSQQMQQSTQLTLAANGGNHQTAPTGGKLATDLSVLYSDGNGNGQANVAVTWTVATGGGSLAASHGITDANGVATNQWTLGPNQGAQTVSAAVAGGSSVTFTATATPNVLHFVIGAGDGQTASPGGQVAVDPEVHILDSNGNPPSAGVIMHWFVTAGGGSVGTVGASSLNEISDAQGYASAAWYLGSSGTQTLVASLANSPTDPSAVSFTATVTTSTSPGPGLIIFQSDRTGKRQIYTITPSSLQLTPVDANSSNDEHPSFGPGRGFIAFASDRTGNDQIYLMTGTGANVGRLTNGPDSDDQPSLSPDGSTIVFRRKTSGVASLYTVGVSGLSTATLLTALQAGSGGDPKWRPDGHAIVYRDGSTIMQIAASGGTGAVLIPNASSDGAPAYSPNGTTVAFVRNNAIALYDVSSQVVTPLTTGSTDDDPAWSPNGLTIIFSRRQFTGADLRLFVVNVASKQVGPMSTGSVAGHDDRSPDWK